MVQFGMSAPPVVEEEEEGGDDEMPSPGLGSTMLCDLRTSLQAATDLAEMQALYSATAAPVGGASVFYEPDVDGEGTKALGCEWSDSGDEQELFHAITFDPSPDNTPFYVRMMMRLGKSASSGGAGALNVFSLGGSNPHQKPLIFARNDEIEGGVSPTRSYLAMRPGDTKMSADGHFGTGFSGWNSDFLGIVDGVGSNDGGIYEQVGEILDLCVVHSPAGAGSGAVEMWVNGALRMRHTGLTIGTKGLLRIQHTVTTRIPEQVQNQFVWGLHAWY